MLAFRSLVEGYKYIGEYAASIFAVEVTRYQT